MANPWERTWTTTDADAEAGPWTRRWNADAGAPGKPAPEPGLLDRAAQGLRSTVSAGQIAATDDPGKIADLVAEEQRTKLAPTAAQQRMAQEVAPLQQAYEKATGLGAVGAFASLAAKRLAQFVSNPREFAGSIAENLPNSAPGMAGALAGGAAGAMTPVPFAGAAGAVVGGTAGGYFIEQGAAMRDQILKAAQEQGLDPRDPKALEPLIREQYQAFLERSRLKGIGTAGTDAVLNAVTLGVAGAGGRALTKEARALTEGVKTGAITSADAAGRLAALEARQAARNTLPARAARGGGIIAAEMGGEGLSEAAGQKLAYGQVDALDVIDESILGLGQGTATAAGQNIYNRVTGAPTTELVDQSIAAARDAISRQRTPAPPVAPPAPLAAEQALGQAVDDLTRAVDPFVGISAARTTDEVIAAAGAATQVDLTPPDVLSMAEMRARADREAALLAQADKAGTGFDRRMALEQIDTVRPAPTGAGAAAGFVDLTPMDPLQARQRLAVLQDQMGDPLSLEIVPHPAQEGRLAIARRALPVQAGDLDLTLPREDVPPAQAQGRLEAAALAGSERTRRAEDAPRQAMIDRALANIEARGGVASPYEAEMLRAANMGRPFDRIDATLAAQPTADERLTAATGIAVGSEAGLGFGARSSTTQAPTAAPFQYADGRGRQRREETPAQDAQPADLAGTFVQQMRETATPAARAFVRDYDAGRITDAEVMQALEAQRGMAPSAQQRIEGAAQQAPGEAGGLRVAQGLRARGVNPVLADAVTLFGGRPVTEGELTVEGAAGRLERMGTLARQPAQPAIPVEQGLTPRAEFPGRAESINTGAKLPRPARVGGAPAATLTDEQLRTIAGNEALPAITRRGASIELMARRQEQGAQRGERQDAGDADARLAAAAEQGRLSQPSDGRVIVTGARLSTQRLGPGSRFSVRDGKRPDGTAVEHDVRVVEPSRLGNTGRLLQQIARIFGKRLVVFESDTLAADGFVQDGDNDSIFINANSQISPLAVFGHELTHLIKRDNPQAYAALQAVVQREIREGGLEQFAQEYGEGADIEELASDLVGNRFQEADFWQSVFDEIAAQNPEGARGIVQRLAAALTRAVNAFLKVARGPGFQADQYVNDLQAVKDAVRTALVAYTQGRREAATAMAREGAPGYDSDASTGDGNARFSQPRAGQGVSGAAEEDGRGAGQDGRGEPPRYGAPREGAISVVGRHYSTQQRATLNGAFYRTGIAGRERTRLDDSLDPRLNQRIYFYVDAGSGIRPEPGVGAFAHEVRLDNVYDPASGLIPRQDSFNAFESAVLNAGFDGYIAPFMNQRAVVLLGPKHTAVPVRALGRVASAPVGAGTAAAPTTLRKSLLADEIQAIDTSRIPGAQLRSGSLVIPSDQTEAANAELERIGSGARFSKQRLIASASLDESLRTAQTRAWPRGRELKLAIQQKVLDAAMAAGIDVSEDSEQTRAYLREVGLRDALVALRQNPNAIGWYDLKTRQALAVMALVHPEIARDENARFAFTWALAVTSNGLKVGKNFELAERVYAAYKQTGRMPNDVGIGTARGAIDDSLQLFNDLRDAWGIDNLRQFMQTNFTVSEITGISSALKPGGEHADVAVKGAAILGPKIGNGFFSNLYGNFDSLTMDRWLIRTWGRWTGTLIKPMPEQTAKARARLASNLATIVASPDEARRLGGLVGLPINADTDVDALAAAVQKASMEPTTRAALNESDVGLELRKAGNSLAKYLDGQKEAPANPDERKYIRAVFADILSELRQTEQYKDLTMADLQAVLWYAEKRLYETAKENPEELAADEDVEGYADDEAPDYANAAADVARKNGVTDRRINATLKRVENERSGAARPADAEGDAQGQGAGAGQPAAPGGFTRQQKRKFIGERAVLRIRANREGNAQQPGAYARDSGEDSGRVRLLKALGVKYTEIWKIESKAGNVFRANAVEAPVFLELERSEQSAARFKQAISQNKAALKFGAAVYVYPAEDYRGMRLFLSRDGKSGVAIKPDGDIVSVFSAGGAGRAVMELAVSAGGRKLDAFDTILPEFYAPHGFRAVARTRWNDEFAPSDWDKDTFRQFNNGEPDVVFMVYDPAKLDAEYTRRDGRVMDGDNGYERAVRMQTREMNRARRENPGRFSRQRDVLARDPRLEEAAQELKEGTATREQYEDLVNALKPVTPYKEVPAPATEADMRRALTSDKVDRIGAPSAQLKAGDPVGLRLDIPAYANHGVWVVSVHDQVPGFAAGKSIGYESVAAVTNPAFGVVETAALNIAGGKPKATIAVMKGAWKPVTEKQAAATAKMAMKSGNWVQVGMDPTRHAYFYDRASMEPVVFADEAVQIGPLVLAKNPVYGKKSDFRFSRQRQTDTPEFRRWFGDSKVVDENGEPLVVYHGAKEDIEDGIFRMEKGMLGTGAYFTSNPKEAEFYTQNAVWRTDPNIVATYVSIRNPYYAKDKWDKGALKARENGHDGVILIAPDGGVDWAIPFSPTQIKSAIGNAGTFDPANPDIRMSRRRDVAAADEALDLVRKARAYEPMEGEERVAFPILYHSGTGDPDSLADGVEPQFGSWVTEVLSGATDEDVDPEESFVPLSYYASAPEWIRMQTARKIGKEARDVTLEDIRQHGQLSIVYNVDEQWGEAKNEVFQIGPDGYNGGYTEVIDVYGKKRKLYEVGLEEEGDYRSGPKTLFGVEPGDIVTKDSIEPDVVLTGDALVEFMRRYQEEIDPQIKFSPRRNIFGQRMALANWTAPSDTKLDRFLYTMQDKQIDTKRVVQAIRAGAGAIDDEWDAYERETLYHGRTAKQTKGFLVDELRPLLQDMQARGVSVADLEAYLHNRHAEERNRQIARINPAMPDKGSGIKTADARAYLAGLDPAKRRAYEALARRVDAITAGTRLMLVASGLETQDTIDQWERTYGSYVPLMREDLDFALTSGGMGTGQGYQVRGAASRRATGSTRPVVDILANVAMQRERAIVRAEKARVARAVYGLAVQYPNTSFWLAVDPAGQKDPNKAMADLMAMGINPIDAQNIVEEPTQPYVDPRTGLVTQRVNPLLRNSDNVLAVRIDGQEKYVFFNANDERSQRMAAALKNLDADQLGRVMSLTAQVTRYFASINTQYNPIFGAINFLRDVQGAALNLSTTPIAGDTAKVLGNAMLALRGIYSDLRSQRAGRGPATGTWATLWEEFQREGGQTGFRDMFSRSEERAQALQAEIDRMQRKGYDPRRLVDPNNLVFGWLSDYNETMENAVRLAAYKAAKDRGMSAQQAASLAKNLTVNFNRKGQVATQAGALYAFFNASVQGTARLAETLKGPAGRKIIAGGLLLGTVQAMLLAAAGFDEDEPPEFVKERNLVIPTGEGKYLTIPMPLGFNVLPNTSRVITEWAMSGWRDPAKRVGQITGAFLEMFNPIGNAGWSVQTIAPTVADPLVALAENRDWTGKPIAKEDRSGTDPTPGYTRAKETASAFGKGLAEFLNLASGGTKYKPGLISPTPDQIDYLIGQATGGVGREALKIEQSITSSITGEELPPYKVPVLGRFYGDARSSAAESNRFYANITRLNEHENEIEGRRKNREDVAGYLAENPEARLVTVANRVESDVQKLRRRKREMLERDASPESIKLIEAQITARMKSLNDRVRAVRDAETVE